MLSLLPIIFFILIYFIFQKSKTISSWRISFLEASLVWGIIVLVTTELLSLFRLIGFWEILGVWVANVIFALIFLFEVNHSNKSIKHLCPAGVTRFDLLLLTGIGLLIITVGVTGLISPPNGWDSLTYHMSRIVHWLQNGSVAYYPTHILRQLHQNPWAEFAILHFQILSDSDRFAFLIQWFSMVGSTLGISLIAKELGAGPRGQIFASVISVTIPMGILQGSGTQNDYVVSFWLVCFASFVILLKKHGKLLDSLAVGASLGLAILTKATAYIYAFPFLVWLALSLIKSHRIKGFWLITIILTVATAINFGHYSRNYQLYANPLGPGREDEHVYSNDIFTLSSVTSNMIRNVALHLGTPFPYVNSLLENQVYKLHRVIGISPNDIRTTWTGTEFHILPPSRHEDTGGNLLHLILMIATIPIIVLQPRKQTDSASFLLCLVSAAILFSLYLKWQPWDSRLHLPLFVLWSALIGLSLLQIRVHNIENILIAILFLGALPYLLENQSRPILGQESILTTSRTKLYFSNYTSLIKPYMSSARFVLRTQCSDIGLILGNDDLEYPFWVLLQNDRRTIRLEHLNVTNISQVKSYEFPFNTFTPCAVIMVTDHPPDEVRIGDMIYLRKKFSVPISVFTRR